LSASPASQCSARNDAARRRRDADAASITMRVHLDTVSRNLFATNGAV
jgi:hypothetical protein